MDLARLPPEAGNWHMLIVSVKEVQAQHDDVECLFNGVLESLTAVPRDRANLRAANIEQTNARNWQGEQGGTGGAGASFTDAKRRLEEPGKRGPRR